MADPSWRCDAEIPRPVRAGGERAVTSCPVGGRGAGSRDPFWIVLILLPRVPLWLGSSIAGRLGGMRALPPLAEERREGELGWYEADVLSAGILGKGSNPLLNRLGFSSTPASSPPTTTVRWRS